MTNVLIAHVPYQVRGGEDQYVDLLAEAYSNLGLNVIRYPDPKKFTQTSTLKSLKSLSFLKYFPELSNIHKRSPIGLIHLNNPYPLLGPHFFSWAASQNIPLIQTIHNHRFFCTNGLALRNGQICKDCFNSKIAWRPMAFNCNGDMKKSTYHSIAMTEMRLSNFIRDKIHTFIAPSPYIKNELHRFGISTNKVFHILNPLGATQKQTSYEINIDVLYAGRLSQEKGIMNLLKSIEKLPNIKFGIAGDGPLKPLIENQLKTSKNLFYFGKKDQSFISSAIIQSKIGILPSICNEILPTFALECFRSGKACIIPELESTLWLAEDPFYGITCNTFDIDAMVNKIENSLVSKKTHTSNLDFLLSSKRYEQDLQSLLKTRGLWA